MTIVQQHRFSVDDYDRLIESGVIDARDRVELIHGVIVDMSPIGSKHAAAVDVLTMWAWRGIGERAIVRSQHPVRCADSVPQPDLALAHPRNDFYAGRHPGPDELYLLVEVAESSLEADEKLKRPLYAAEGVAEYWIVDIADRSLTVHRKPEGDAYTEVRRFTANDTVAPATFADLTLKVATLFPG